MSERRKTLLAAALLAAAVGVYLEVSYQEKLRTEAQQRGTEPAASPASSVPRPPKSTPPRHD